MSPYLADSRQQATLDAIKDVAAQLEWRAVITPP
jgi:hypothetical protein